MSDYKLEPFKVAIGSPTNQERTYLAGDDGVFVGERKAILVHALPIYRQKDYPVYQARKQGPYVVTLYNSGIRISATAQKLVFPDRDGAVKFAETVGGLFNLFGIPMLSEDPREVLEAAKDKKEQVYEPLKAMAESMGAVFIVPQKE